MTDQPEGPTGVGRLRARIARERLPIAFGTMIALFYGVGMIVRGHALPGIVGGLLGGLLGYLVMREAELRQRRRDAQRGRPPRDG